MRPFAGRANSVGIAIGAAVDAARIHAGEEAGVAGGADRALAKGVGKRRARVDEAGDVRGVEQVQAVRNALGDQVNI